MVGGLNRYSCYAAAAVGLLFLVAYPLAGIVGYVPNLVIAAICVYIGADFLWDNLVTAAAQNGAAAAAGSIAVLALCVRKDMLWGSLLGVAGFKVAASRSPGGSASSSSSSSSRPKEAVRERRAGCPSPPRSTTALCYAYEDGDRERGAHLPAAHLSVFWKPSFSLDCSVELVRHILYVHFPLNRTVLIHYRGAVTLMVLPRYTLKGGFSPNTPFS